MKKKLLISLFASTLLLASPVFAEVASIKSTTENTTQSSAQETTTNQVDITPNFSLVNKIYKVNEHGNAIKVGPIQGVTPKGTFKEIKNEFIDLKADGSFIVLSEDKFEITPEYTLDPDSLTEIKAAYIKNNNLVNVTEDDITTTQKNGAQIITFEGINVDKKEQVEIDTTLTFSIDQKEIAIGDSAKLSVEPIEGVSVTGTYSGGTESVKIGTDGTVTPLKSGESLKFTPLFELSEQSKKDIFEAIKKKPGNEDLTIKDVVFTTKDIAQVIDIKVNPIEVGLAPTVSNDKMKITVGETAKLTLDKIEGVQLTGMFTPYKDEIAELKADGTVTGLKVGTTSVLVSDYQVSDESTKELVAAYNKKLGLTTLTSEDIVFVKPTVAVNLAVEVVAKATTSDTTNTTTSSSKTYAPASKTLPQTGESTSSFVTVAGLLVLASGGIIYLKRRIVK